MQVLATLTTIFIKTFALNQNLHKSVAYDIINNYYKM